MTASLTQQRAHRERDIADNITGTRWCTGHNGPVPLERVVIYRGKPYCKACRDKARKARAKR